MSLNTTMLASIRAAVKNTPQYARTFSHVLSAQAAFKFHCDEQETQFSEYEDAVRKDFNTNLNQTMWRRPKPNEPVYISIKKIPRPPLMTQNNQKILIEYILDDYRRAGWDVGGYDSEWWPDNVRFIIRMPYYNGGGGGGCGTNTSCGGVGLPTSLDVGCDNDNL